MRSTTLLAATLALSLGPWATACGKSAPPPGPEAVTTAPPTPGDQDTVAPVAAEADTAEAAPAPDTAATAPEADTAEATPAPDTAATTPEPDAGEAAADTLGAEALAIALKRCEEQDSGEGCLQAAAFHHNGGYGVPVDMAKADALYRKACGFKEARGCFMVGGLAQQGRLGAADPEAAKTWFAKGCDLDDGMSCASLALLLGGADGAENQEAMRKAFERSCALGTGNGCMMAGIIYDEGKGVERDGAKALGFYEKGCEAGDGPSCANAGGSLMGGARAAGEPDPKRAMAFLEKACELDAANGCAMLGAAYAQGKLVPQDREKAVANLQKACKLGFEPACNMLR